MSLSAASFEFTMLLSVLSLEVATLRACGTYLNRNNMMNNNYVVKVGIMLVWHCLLFGMWWAVWHCIALWNVGGVACGMWVVWHCIALWNVGGVALIALWNVGGVALIALWNVGGVVECGGWCGIALLCGMWVVWHCIALWNVGGVALHCSVECGWVV